MFCGISFGYRVAVWQYHNRLASLLGGNVVNSQVYRFRAIYETRREPVREPVRHERTDLAISGASGRVLLRRRPGGERVISFRQLGGVRNRNRAAGAERPDVRVCPRRARGKIPGRAVSYRKRVAFFRIRDVANLVRRVVAVKDHDPLHDEARKRHHICIIVGEFCLTANSNLPQCAIGECHIGCTFSASHIVQRIANIGKTSIRFSCAD